jgi:maltose O-acetyltransferase
VIYLFLKKIYRSIEKTKRNKYLLRLRDRGLRIGKNVDILDNVFIDPSHCYLISIGNNVTISPNVRLIAHDASTKKTLGYTKIGKIDIRENCFIGDSAIVLYGVTIGPNSIVGAGSVVVKDVPEGVVVAGNPAKVISSTREYIEKIKRMSAKRRIFGEEYSIDRLDGEKRDEIMRSVENSTGFTV